MTKSDGKRFRLAEELEIKEGFLEEWPGPGHTLYGLASVCSVHLRLSRAAAMQMELQSPNYKLSKLRTSTIHDRLQSQLLFCWQDFLHQ